MGELTPAKWKARIDRSLKFQEIRMQEAERFQRAYGGDYNDKPTPKIDDWAKDEATVNFIFSHLETTAPSIFSGDPKVFLDPQDPQSEAAVDHLEAVVNHWFRKLNFKRHLKMCRFDRYFGMAAFLTEWDFEDELVDVPREVKNPFTGSAIVNPFTGKPVTAGMKKERRTLRDQPLGKRLDPWDVVLDPDCKTQLEARWRALKVYFTKDEFDALPGVTSKIKKEIYGSSLDRSDRYKPFKSGDSNDPSDMEWVTLYRIYDLENDCIKLLPVCGEEATSDFVEIKDWPYDFEVNGDRFPVTILEGKRDAQNPYSFSDYRAYWNQIQEKNRFRTMLQSHVRRMAPGWLAKKNALDEEQKKKFTAAKIAEYVEANNPDGIKERPLPKFPQDLFLYNNVMSDDLLDVSGFAEYRNDSIADTATEANMLEGRSKIRKGESRDDFMDFVATIGGKTAGLCQQFQTAETAVKIRNPENPRELIWIHTSREEIQGEFLYSAKPGVMQQSNEDLHRQQTLKLVELMAGNPHADQRKLAEKAVKTFDYEPDEVLRPEQEVKAEQEAAMQANQEPQEPDIKFDKIKFELLPPQIQAMILQAGMVQNEVKPDGSNDGAAPAGPAGSPASLQNPTGNSVMPGAGINQAPPPMEGGTLPPATPVQPISESQGGPT
jgi:hypothetical protein